MSQLRPTGTTLPVPVDREPSLLLTTGTATDVGGRSDNQDAVVSRRLGAFGSGEGQEAAGQLLAVADGMGGHENGDLASQIAIESLLAQVESDGGTDAATLLKRAYREANSRIFETGSGDGSGESNMGTTLVAAIVRGKYATIANVGDSRAYLIRANRLNQLTQDHSLVAQQVAQGEISAADARTSPHRNRLTQALGQRQKLDNRLPDIFEITLLPKDRLLLCSDGFYDVVPDADLVSVVLGSSAEVSAATLVDLGKQRGTSDNVSAVVLAADREIVEPVVEVREAGGGSNTIVMLLIAVGVILFIAIVVAALTIL